MTEQLMEALEQAYPGGCVITGIRPDGCCETYVNNEDDLYVLGLVYESSRHMTTGLSVLGSDGPPCGSQAKSRCRLPEADSTILSNKRRRIMSYHQCILLGVMLGFIALYYIGRYSK